MAHLIPRLVLSQIPTLLLTLALLPILVACGRSRMTIRSAAFHTSGSAAVVYGAVEPATTVNVFRVCVARIRLDGEDDEAVAGADDARFTPGLPPVACDGRRLGPGLPSPGPDPTGARVT